MKKLFSLVAIVVMVLAACRSEAERTPLAQVAGSEPSASASAASHEVEASDVRLRRLWSGSDFNFYASSPSPDGRYVTEIDWSTGDLAVRDLVTGSLHRLTDKGGWETSGDYADPAIFSPDGRRIAYSWNHEATGTYQVRLLDFTVDGSGIPRGSKPAVIHPGGPQHVYWLYGWTSEDELLTGVYRPDNSTALAFLSLHDGSLRVLKSFDWEDAHAALSPDGRLIAYDHAPGSDPNERDIYLISTDGSVERVLVDSPGRDVVLGWTRDGRALLFHSEGSGTPSVWRLPMSTVGPTATAELIQPGVRSLEPLGFAGDDYYFGSEVEAPSFRFARLDEESHSFVPLNRPTEAERGWDVPRVTEWAPDGEHMIQDVPQGPTSTRWQVRRSDGSLVRQLELRFRLNRWLMRWTPDGRGVVVAGHDNRGRAGFFRVDLASGAHEVLRHFDPETGRLFSLSPDGNTLYFTRESPDQSTPPDRRIDLVALDLASGNERPIHTVLHPSVDLGAGHSSPLVPAPDGRSVAYPELDGRGGKMIRLLSLDSGTVQTLHHMETQGLEFLGWSPEGRDFFFLVHPPEDEDNDWSIMDAELWRVSSRGGDGEQIAVIEDYVGGARLHPDGRTIAYRAGRYRGEIWALQVFEGNQPANEGVDE